MSLLAILIVKSGPWPRLLSALTWVVWNDLTLFLPQMTDTTGQELENKSVGRPQIGGPFTLLDQTGKEFTDKDLLGKWSLIYFGFTNCPDICPEELDKMANVVDVIDKESGPVVTPVFVSVDPARDGVPQVAHYVEEFHPRLIGLTGDYDSVKKACKSYRVYFSTPPDAKATDDYLVDHR